MSLFELPKMPQIPTLAETFISIAEELNKVQEDLEADKELLLFIETPRGEQLRVIHLRDRGASIVELVCEDSSGDALICVSSISSLQLFCKVVTVPTGSVKRKIGFESAGHPPAKENV